MRSRRTKSARRSRLNYGSLPAPPGEIQVPYAKRRKELADLTIGDMALLMAYSDAFQSEILPICEQLDLAREGKRGPKPLYTSVELEVVLLCQQMDSFGSYKAVRDWLSSDRGLKSREALGMNRPRTRKGEGHRTLTSGIPSEATMSRHLKRFGIRRRYGAYIRFWQRIREENFVNFPEMRTDARILSLDGSKLETHYTCPIYDGDRLVNGDSVTCPDGGYVGLSAGPDKSGHGFNLVILTSLTGLPVSWELVPLQAGESTTAIKMIEGDVKRNVTPLLNQDELHVVIADGAFHRHGVRESLRSANLIEQIHPVSHGDSTRSRRNAKKHDEMTWLIDGHEDWVSNGHYEIRCLCGEGQTSKRFSRTDKGVKIRTEGSCESCGPISITAGRWRKVQNYKRTGQTAFVRCQPDELDKADQAFGNPLTYNSMISEEYGRKRFGNGEGFHGHLTTRFGLLRGKSWIRRGDKAKTEIAIVFSLTHILAMEQRRRAAAAATSNSPPG